MTYFYVMILLAVNCSTPAPPKNGYIDMMLSIDQIIYYGCNEGYAPIDVRRAVCVDQDTWSSLPQQLNCTNNMQPSKSNLQILILSLTHKLPNRLVPPPKKKKEVSVIGL